MVRVALFYRGPHGQFALMNVKVVYHLVSEFINVEWLRRKSLAHVADQPITVYGPHGLNVSMIPVILSFVVVAFDVDRERVSVAISMKFKISSATPNDAVIIIHGQPGHRAPPHAALVIKREPSLIVTACQFKLTVKDVRILL